MSKPMNILILLLCMLSSAVISCPEVVGCSSGGVPNWTCQEGDIVKFSLTPCYLTQNSPTPGILFSVNFISNQTEGAYYCSPNGGPGNWNFNDETGNYHCQSVNQ